MPTKITKNSGTIVKEYIDALTSEPGSKLPRGVDRKSPHIKAALDERDRLPEQTTLPSDIQNERKINAILDKIDELKSAPSTQPELESHVQMLEHKLKKLLQERKPDVPTTRTCNPVFKALLWVPGAVVSRVANVGFALLGAQNKVSTRGLVMHTLHAIDIMRPWGIPLIKRPKYSSTEAQIRLLDKWGIALDLPIPNRDLRKAVISEPGSRHFVKFLHKLRTIATYSPNGLPLEQRQQLKHVMLAMAADETGELTRKIFKIAKGGFLEKDLDEKRHYMPPGALHKLEDMNRTIEEFKKKLEAEQENNNTGGKDADPPTGTDKKGRFSAVTFEKPIETDEQGSANPTLTARTSASTSDSPAPNDGKSNDDDEGTLIANRRRR